MVAVLLRITGALFLFFLLIGVCTSSETRNVPNPLDIQVVHVVTMNHLDVGFDGISPEIGYARNVINKYFDVFFPKSIRVSQELRDFTQDRMIYTTYSFLVSLFLDCPAGMGLHCPNATAVQQFKDAVNRGDITWHAFPFNAEAELADPSLFNFGIQLSHDLSDRFGLNRSNTMSQQDVPGITRSVIPLLKKRGVQAIMIGANEASAPAAVPKAFLWYDPASSQHIIALYHPGGYGGITLKDCVWGIPGLSHAICYEFEGDNKGPPDVAKVTKDWALIRREFPNAQVIASTFDSFINELIPFQYELPLYDFEMGDTWIYGSQTDPFKTASSLAIQRVRSNCIERGECSLDDPRFYNFSRIFIKNIEHTWGLDVKTYLDDWLNWSNKQFESVRNQTNYQEMILSWIEQRAFTTWAIEALEAQPPLFPQPHPLLGEINEALSEINEKPPSPTGCFQPIHDLASFSISTPSLLVSFDPKHGGINKLQDKKTGREWAGPNNPLGQFLYQTFTAEDYDHYIFDEYSNCPSCEWAFADYCKPNVSEAHPKHTQSFATVSQAFSCRNSSLNQVLLVLSVPSWAHETYGAPQSLQMLFTINETSSEIEGRLFVLQKTPTRLPEAGWISFVPFNTSITPYWGVYKLGEAIRVDEVVVNGSFHLHASMGKGVVFDDHVSQLSIIPIDSALVSMGAPIPFPSPLKVPDMSKGVHLNLFNNIWGTNYPMWYPFLPEDSDFSTRFLIRLS